MKRIYLIIFFISQPLYAIEYIWKEECDKTQRTMTLCAKEMFKFNNKELNLVYKNVMKSLPSNKKKQLRAEQRIWLKTRDPNCKLEANDEAEGGSMWPMVYNGCRAESTSKRTVEIKRWK